MKRCFFALALFVSLFVPSAKATMVRVIDVIDARTIVVDDNGRRTTVVIAGIALSDTETADATPPRICAALSSDSGCWSSQAASSTARRMLCR